MNIIIHLVTVQHSSTTIYINTCWKLCRGSPGCSVQISTRSSENYAMEAQNTDAKNHKNDEI